MVSFRSPRKLSSYLVRAKLYPIERTVGCNKCGNKRCEVDFNINETDTFTSSVTGEKFKINHKLDCNNNCLVYLLTCTKCLKQYTGQTTDNFRLRWNNYKCCSRKYYEGKLVKQQHIYDHFNNRNSNGFIQDVSIIFIDKKESQIL